jgi:uncharacterized membrane protein YdjX (TVP38/TMEM64 family)
MKRAKPLLILICIAAVVVALIILPVKESIESFLQWVEGLGYWGPVLVAVIYIPATVLFVPGSLITLGAGAIFGLVVGTITISIGSILGSTASFLIGRSITRNWVASKVAGSAKFKAIDEAVGRSGFKIVLLTRLSPAFPYNLLGYAYGITSARLRDYFFASWIGMFPGTVMYVYLGTVLGSVAKVAAGTSESRQRTAGEWALLIVGLFATIAVTIIITRIARNAMKDEIREEAADR